MGKSSGSSERPVTAEERRLWDAQAEQLDVLAKISEEQFGLSQEDRQYYEDIFRDGTDTQAKDAIAELQSRITGVPVDPATIESVNIDTLLRDTILNATPEFQQAATAYIDSANQLTTQYGADVSGLSSAFSQGIQDLTSNYSQELQTIKEQTGTINQDVLSRETGAATAGISSAYSEARKQMTSDLARRGLVGSGVEANVMADMYQQEAMAKGSAIYNARTSALGISESIRQQQANLAGQQLQANTAGLQTGYQAELGGVQNVYGVTTAQGLQNYQTSQNATLQGIAGLTQLAQAGQGIYAGSANYLTGAASTSSSAAQIAGSSASSLGSLNTQYTLAQQQRDDAAAAGIGSLFGTTISAAGQAGSFGTLFSSDKRLKTNIEFKEVRNGYNIYTWDWIDGFDGGYNEGVIAQEVMEINPDAVVVMDNGYYGVNYSMLGV